MSSTIKCVSVFVVGAGIGSIVTWKFVKRKYEQIADEEIAKMREYYKEKCRTEDDSADEQVVSSESTDEKKVEFTAEEKIEYSDIIKKQGYTSDENIEKGGDPVITKERPYVIPPEDFGEIDEYDTESLTYYEDGVLTDSDDEIIDNVEELIGRDSLTHFGEYEDDSVFVRNDVLKRDFEILRDLRKYSDANRPRYMGV